MILAGLFAGALFLGLLVGDRWYFRTLSAEASRYGCKVGRGAARLESISLTRIHACFDKLGLLPMRHGVARLFTENNRILLRPRYPTLWAFLWIWPMKTTIDLQADGEAVVLASTKRTPWASAILTGAWFLIVTLGTLATVISFGVEGGLANSGGVLMGGGILTLGLFFIFSGLVTVVMAYRMENNRLAVLQQEFQDVLNGRVSATR
ncbi:MAG: hypothetical protein QG615_687 [Nitrospirota bacterium]|nr:hypothetical protein [Nitrospirota bacterium]